MAKLAGILALQGAYAKHARAFASLGLEPVFVREPAQLAGLDVLALPGGESTTMSLLLDTTGLREPLRQAVLPRSQGGQGLPTLATCAGVIILARELRRDSGSLKVTPLNVLDAVVDRNAFGRQVDSFEAELEVDWAALGRADAEAPLHGVFIRAPLFLSWGAGVQILCRHAGQAVLARQENILAASFHPELTDDTRLHETVLGFT